MLLFKKQDNDEVHAFYVNIALLYDKEWQTMVCAVPLQPIPRHSVVK